MRCWPNCDHTKRRANATTHCRLKNKQTSISSSSCHYVIILSPYHRHTVVILSCRHITISPYHHYIPVYDCSKSPARVKYIQSYPGHVIIALLLCYTLSKQFLPSSTITVHKWSGGKLPVMSCHNVVTLRQNPVLCVKLPHFAPQIILSANCPANLNSS